MKNSRIGRRDFLSKSGKTILGAGAALQLGGISGRVLGANERLVMGIIGAGRMGWSNMSDFLKVDGVEIAAACDVYEPHLERAIEITDGKATGYKDYRRIIDRKDIDAVIVATPDHWHALPTIQACQAGKDVYVEKPISHNIYEGRKMVEAARKYKRVVQVGTQQRSGAHFQAAVELVRAGVLGPIGLVRTWYTTNQYPDGIGNPPDTNPPPDLDWNTWLGPAPKVPYNLNRWKGSSGWSTFRYFWDYTGGMLTDWGVHLLDIVQWAMDADSPLAVTSRGGKYHITDNRDTPDTSETVIEYPGFTCIYADCATNNHGIDGHGYGIQFYGTNGTLYLDRSGYQVKPQMRSKGLESSEAMGDIRSEGSDQHLPHVRNFVDCVKSRKLPVSDIEIGHHSTTTPLLAKISYITKERVEWDAKNERITNSQKANALVKRDYRKPWILPETV